MTEPRPRGTASWLSILLAIAVLGGLYFWKGGALSGLLASPASAEAQDRGSPTQQGKGAPPVATRPAVAASVPRVDTKRADTRAVQGYAPASRDPKDAIPGGSLKAHEGIEGSHTVSRHVGKTLDFLKKRAEDESKRRVSTFKDIETADTAVAEILFQNQTAIRKWLASRPVGNQDFDGQLRNSPGTVWLADKERSVPGRTVVVVIAPNRRFPEGFRIVTAYVDTP